MRQLILCKGRSVKERLSSFSSMDANHSLILNIIGALKNLVAYILGMFESEVAIDLNSMYYPTNVNTICDNDCKCKQGRARLPCSGINNVRAIVAE